MVVLGVSSEVIRVVVVLLPNAGTELSSGFVVCTEMLLSATDWTLDTSNRVELFCVEASERSFLAVVDVLTVVISRGSCVGGTWVVVKLRFTTIVVLVVLPTTADGDGKPVF